MDGWKVYEGLVEDALEAGILDESGANGLLAESPGIIRGAGAGALANYFIQRGSLQYLRRFAEPENSTTAAYLRVKCGKKGWLWKIGVPDDLLEDADLGGLISVYQPKEWTAAKENPENVHSFVVLTTIVRWLDDAGYISPKEGDQLLSGKFFSKSRLIKVLRRAVEAIDPKDDWGLFTHIKLHHAKQKEWIENAGFKI